MTTPNVVVAESDLPVGRSRAQTAAGIWRRLASSPLTLVGMLITLVLVTLGVFAPLIAPHDYAQQDLLNSFAPPFTREHLLGTDQLGRDTFSRLLYGIRISIFVGFVITAISLFFGGLVGLDRRLLPRLDRHCVQRRHRCLLGIPLDPRRRPARRRDGPGVPALMLAVGDHQLGRLRAHDARRGAVAARARVRRGRPRARHRQPQDHVRGTSSRTPCPPPSCSARTTSRSRSSSRRASPSSGSACSRPSRASAR